MTNEQDLAVALEEASAWVGQVPGVVAVGEGAEEGTPTIDVWVSGPSSRSLPDASRSLPDALHGVTVRVRRSGGPIEAQ